MLINRAITNYNDYEENFSSTEWTEIKKEIREATLSSESSGRNSPNNTLFRSKLIVILIILALAGGLLLIKKRKKHGSKR